VTIRTRLGIRHRVVGWIVVLLALVLVASGALVTNILRDRLVGNVDDQLDRRVADVGHAMRQPGEGFPGGRGNDPFTEQSAAYVLLDSDGTVVGSIPLVRGGHSQPLPDVSKLVVSTAPRTVDAVGGGGPRYRARTIGLGNGTLVAAVSLADVDASVRSARQALALGGLITLLAAAAVVWFTVRRGLRPIDDMVTTAEHIAAGDLTERTPVRDPNTEVGHLGTALNTMLDHIEEAMAVRTASEGRLRRFAADASHELRTPLTSIRGYAELYRQGATDPDDVARGMARIEREATRMGDLVEDLLLLARLDQGHELRADPVDLGAIVADAVDAATVIEPDRRIDVGRPPGPVEIEGDADRLRQVVDNLLANVREHTAPETGVTITLTTDRLTDTVTLVVADDGPGMTEDEAQRAFDRFWQGEQTLEHPRHGTGLGLAIVRDLVASHGGSVAIDTAPGAGGSVSVTLPRRLVDAPATETD
jgi:two-component system OmpR family sensor kinase